MFLPTANPQIDQKSVQQECKFKATKKIIKISDYLVPNGVISRAKASYLKITAPPQAKYSVAYKASTAFLKASKNK